MKYLEIKFLTGVGLFAALADTPQEPKHAYISYFVNGVEVTDFNDLITEHRQEFNSMANDLCYKHGLIKYSY